MRQREIEDRRRRDSEERRRRDSEERRRRDQKRDRVKQEEKEMITGEGRSLGGSPREEREIRRSGGSAREERNGAEPDFLKILGAALVRLADGKRDQLRLQSDPATGRRRH